MSRFLSYVGIGMLLSLLGGMHFGSFASIGEPYRDVGDVMGAWIGLTLVGAAMSAVVCVPLTLGTAIWVRGLHDEPTGWSRPLLLGLLLSQPFAGVWSLSAVFIDFREPATEILTGNPAWTEWSVLELGAAVGVIGCLASWIGALVMHELRNRPRDGHCDRCGYDLSGTPGRCPECGARTETALVDSGDGKEDQDGT